MLQPPENQQKSTQFANLNNTPPKTGNPPLEQATVGRSLVIKGEVSGAESLYVDGRIEGTINIPENRVTIGRNGVVAADVNAREVVIMGKVNGNISCSDRLDIRSEGSVTGDVVTQRISVEDGAQLRGSVQVQAAEQRKSSQPPQAKPAEPPKPAEAPKALVAAASGQA